MANDLASLVPATVTVAFPATGSGAPASGYYTVPVTLSSLSLVSYGNIIGAPWKKLLHRYEVAVYAGGGCPGNATALGVLATQIATDWYAWQLAKLDQYFTGIVNWTLEGFHDLEFRQVHGRITTHVQRGKFNPIEDLIGTPGSSSQNQEPCTGITLTEEEVHCEAGVLNVYARTVTLNTIDGCLDKSVGPFVLVRTEGNCAPETVNVINYTTIDNFTSYVQNVTYLNTYDGSLYINVDGVWFQFCPCGYGSGSGSGNGGGFWYCIETIVPDPPAWYCVETISGSPVTVPCCIGPVPATLTGTFSSKTGYAVAFPTTATFTYDAGNDWWVWNSGLNCGFGPNGLMVFCSGSDSSGFLLGDGVGNITPFSPVNPDVSPAPDCSPFQLIWSISGTFACGAMSYKLTLTG